MPYTPTVWVEQVTTLGPTNLNKLETGVQAAYQQALAAILANGANAGGIEITNAATPTAQTSVATKGYVDTINQNTQSGTTYTLVLADAGKIIVATNASPSTITIPANASVAFPIGTVIGIKAGTSAGTVTIAAAGGVTLVNPYSSFALFGPNARAELLKIGTDAWTLNGEVA